jgi:Flp pilus assembly protein TadB
MGLASGAMLGSGVDAERLLAALGAAFLCYCVARFLACPPESLLRLGRLANAGLMDTEGEGVSRSAGDPEGGNSLLRRVILSLGAAGRLVPEAWVLGSDRLRRDNSRSDETEGRAALVGLGITPFDVHLAGVVAGVGFLGVLFAAELAGLRVPDIIGVLVAGTAVIGPRLWMKGRLGAYRMAIGRELPRVAELLTMGTESGLGLLEAMRLTSGLCVGQVGLALRDTLREIDAGREPLPALRAMASRLGGQETSTFLDSVSHGLALGVPVARVLRGQADALRTRRRQVLESRISGLSMKLSVVTIIFFVPALFVLSVLPNLMAFLRGQW